MSAAGSNMSAEAAQESRAEGLQPETERALLLLVSDDPAILAMAQCDIERSFKIPRSLKNATHPSDVWAAINEQIPDLLILDSQQSSDLNALDLLMALRREPTTHDLPVVFLAHSSKEAAMTAAWPFVRTLIKPFGSLDFCAVLEESLPFAKAHTDNRHPFRR